jgi:pimeloyl-ACP methyl ester carboxylesterase
MHGRHVKYLYRYRNNAVALLDSKRKEAPMADSVLGKTREIETPAGPIRYRERGEGPPIVFLHEIIANGWLWRRVVPALDDVTLVANDTGGAIAQWVAVHDPARLGRLVLTPCDAFENFLPPALRHLQLFGRTPAGLWLLAQSLRFRAIYRLPIAFGRLTVRPIDPEAMDCYTSPLRTNPAVRADFARLVRAISSNYTQEAAEALRSLRLLCGRWTTACSRCATAIGSPIGCRRVRL